MAPNQPARHKVQLNLRIDRDLKAAAMAKAEAEGRDFAEVVRDLLRGYVQR